MFALYRIFALPLSLGDGLNPVATTHKRMG